MKLSFLAFIKILSAISILFLLNGCASTIASRVTTFHQLPPNNAGKSFIIEPENSAKKTSVEFQTYALLIASKLETEGYYTALTDDADLLVKVHYTIDNGKNVQQYRPFYRTRNSSLYYCDGRSAHYNDNPHFSGWLPYATTVYKSQLSVKIFDKNPSSEKEAVALYEGKVTNSNPSGDLSLILPPMIEALFKDFPGNSGESKIVNVTSEN